MTAPDPRNVRDMLLEAGYSPYLVDRMLMAARGGIQWLTRNWRMPARPSPLGEAFVAERFLAPASVQVPMRVIMGGWIDRDAFPEIPDHAFDFTKQWTEP